MCCYFQMKNVLSFLASELPDEKCRKTEINRIVIWGQMFVANELNFGIKVLNNRNKFQFCAEFQISF